MDGDNALFLAAQVVINVSPVESLVFLCCRFVNEVSVGEPKQIVPSKPFKLAGTFFGFVGGTLTLLMILINNHLVRLLRRFFLLTNRVLQRLRRRLRRRITNTATVRMKGTLPLRP